MEDHQRLVGVEAEAGRVVNFQCSEAVIDMQSNRMGLVSDSVKDRTDKA